MPGLKYEYVRDMARRYGRGLGAEGRRQWELLFAWALRQTRKHGGGQRVELSELDEAVENVFTKSSTWLAVQPQRGDPPSGSSTSLAARNREAGGGGLHIASDQQAIPSSSDIGEEGMGQLVRLGGLNFGIWYASDTAPKGVSI